MHFDVILASELKILLETYKGITSKPKSGKLYDKLYDLLPTFFTIKVIIAT